MGGGLEPDVDFFQLFVSVSLSVFVFCLFLGVILKLSISSKGIKGISGKPAR